jgi:protein-S-isoprenylcysteine O-methyltransferase Ste14
MNSSSSPPRPARPPPLLARIGALLATYALMGAVLFLAAGRLDWLDAWIFLVAYFLIAAAAQAWLTRIDPGLVEERWQWGTNTKAWDRWIVAANGLLLFALLLVIGLDAGRFGWSYVPWPVRLAALLGFVPAFGLPLLASRANTYLASTVRIQEERGHTVVSAGPYAFIRHPMYAGTILYDVCVPPLLGSWVGLAVSAVMITMAVLRTTLEDRTLQAELPGYREYARRVRFRLLPGVW